MSVMTPDQLRNGPHVDMRGRPVGPLQPAPGLQTQAVIDAMGEAPAAAPVTPAPSAGPAANPGLFARGGQVQQLPSNAGARAEQIAGIGSSVATTAAGASNPYGAVGSYFGKKLKPKEEMPTFGGANAAYLDHLGRRFEGAGPGIAGGAATGAGYGAVAGPVGAAVGAGVGALIGAATKNAKSAFSDFRVEDAAQAIRDAYKGELGRDASDEEVMGMLTGQGWDPNDGDRWVGEKGINAVLDHIRASPEAVAFRAGGAQPGAEATVETSVPEGAVREGSMRDVAAAMAGDTDSSGWDTDGYGKPAVIAQNVKGSAPAGWDQKKWNDPNHQTPKYVWGRITQDDNPNDVEQLLAAYPGASFNGKDKVTGIPGLGPIDIYKGASVGENTPQWHDINAAEAEGGGGDDALLAALTGGNATGAPAGGGDTSSLPGVMQAIQALLARQGQTNQSGYTDALLRELNATA